MNYKFRARDVRDCFSETKGVENFIKLIDSAGVHLYHMDADFDYAWMSWTGVKKLANYYWPHLRPGSIRGAKKKAFLNRVWKKRCDKHLVPIGDKENMK